MRRTLCVLLLVVFGGFWIAAARTSHHSSSTPRGSRSSTRSRPAHVRGYTRRDGTYVASHERGPAGTSSSQGSPSRPEYRPYRSGHVATGFAAHSSVRVGPHGRIRRITAAKDAFKRQQPCPSTGKGSGSCPDYVIDHVRPLECGGADAPSNMQWQTIAEGKAKDKTERACR
jgi:hypothetical protein